MGWILNQNVLLIFIIIEFYTTYQRLIFYVVLNRVNDINKQTECYSENIFFCFICKMLYVAAFDNSGRTVANAITFWAARLTF